MEQVLVYGAGLTAKKLFSRICETYAPVCFLDRDPAKQGKAFCGLPVLSPESGLEKYPDAHILLAVSHFLKYDVTDWLLEHDVSVERIIGAQGPVERRWGCANMEQYIVFWKNEMRHCCSLAGTYQLPFITSYSASPCDNYFNYVNNNRKYIDMLQNDVSRPQYCNQCKYLKFGNWAQYVAFNEISFSIESPCNYNCIYCGEDDGVYGGCALDDGTTMKAALDFLRYCKETGKLDAFTEVWLAPGEPALHPMLEEILEVIGDYHCTIATNASIYSEAIASVLKRGRSELRVSIDAGTPETYAKVRGVAPRMFGVVRENLLRYAKLCSDAVELQYIILPGKNTADADIDSFCELAAQVSNRVLISRDRNHIGDIDQSAAGAIVKMQRKLKAVGIQTRLFTDSVLCFADEELNLIWESGDGAK